MYLRQQFLQHIAQTSDIPQGFEIDYAEGSYLVDKKGRRYLDLISGFGVNNIGHSIPEVYSAIQQQAQKYLHSTVYGEHIQSPQIALATCITDLLPSSLNSVYFLNSGSECVDASLKLARLATGRHEIVCCRNAYHGSTIAAVSLRSDETHTEAFRPLIPGIRFIDFNASADLDFITTGTAAVITEIVQAEAGVRLPDPAYLEALRKKCTETGALLIVDEIQTGIGRTGTLFAFQKYGVIPDILLSGKALGAGLPLSALICERQIMQYFSRQIPLGHITTFGGNPVCCAAGLAGLNYLVQNKWMDTVEEKANYLKSALVHPEIKEIRNCGLLIAVEFESRQKLMKMISYLYDHQILAESFLFCPQALRIAPVLSINKSELEKIAEVIQNTS
jgi:acetylornithine/N-succinyldiaminopimelate aminotransferase